ncbi:MAG: DUF1549 and DUF1553 domain-containing protein [Isosphaeraceae bacterium]
MTDAPIRRFTGLAALALACCFAARHAAGEPPAARPITEEERSHWAFVPPRRVPPPPVKDASWPRNPIDRFILASLEEAGLRPAPEADRATLIRRLTFDLTGLPPTPEAVDQFVADSAPDAYERLVDRLLADPRHGERWAQHWLDLARYADTDGFEFDQTRPNAWRYRDWVVSAFNDDLPYDQFVRLQLAGDELAGNDPSGLVATGFNRCYPDMVDLNDQGLRRQNALNDITETTGLVFLGLTLGCARCHDHKFDPIRIADFYALQAFFTPAQFRDDLAVASEADRREHARAREQWSRRLADAESALIAFEAPYRAAVTPGWPAGIDDETAAALTRSTSDRTPRDVGRVFQAWSKDRRFRPVWWPIVLDPMSRVVRASLLARVESTTRAEPSRLPEARVLVETSPEAAPTHVLMRGDFATRGPVVEPAVPQVLAGSTVEIRPTARTTGRRTALARWLTRASHPLTARVIVNRLWQSHFGRGIVATPSDVGTMGADPTHPELLDWLALELPAQGWSLKQMHRLILTSSTYRMASTPGPAALRTDPENLLLSHQRRVRLDGESIRDTLLAVSGGLSLTHGGPPVFPELPEELRKLSSKGAVWPVSTTQEERSRRSLYVFIRRNLRYPFFEAFDRPDTNASCPRRSTTTIAPQALTLLNSQLAHDAARALAHRAMREGGASQAGRIDRAFRLGYGRRPRADELQAASEFLARDPAFEHLCLALLNANEFVYID